MRSSSDTNPDANGSSGPTTRTRDAGTHITTLLPQEPRDERRSGRADYSDLSTRRLRNLQGLSAPSRHNQRVGIGRPPPRVHADLAPAAALPGAHHESAAVGVKIGSASTSASPIRSPARHSITITPRSLTPSGFSPAARITAMISRRSKAQSRCQPRPGKSATVSLPTLPTYRSEGKDAMELDPIRRGAIAGIGRRFSRPERRT
jgi:hypothetical protein